MPGSRKGFDHQPPPPPPPPPPPEKPPPPAPDDEPGGVTELLMAEPSPPDIEPTFALIFELSQDPLYQDG